MSDFEQWFNLNFDIIPKQHKGMAKLVWNAALSSLQGEAVATIHQKYIAASEHGMFAYTVYSDKELSVGDKFYSYAVNFPPVAWLLRLKIGKKIERFVRFHPNEGGQPLYTHAPDSASKIAEQDARIKELEERIGEHDICSKLIDAWCAEHGGKITWGKAIDITAIITKMDADERSRLLTLDEPDIQNELVALRGSVKELEQQLEVARKALQFYADVDHKVSLSPWLQKDGWREELKAKGFWHYFTDNDDVETWIETGQTADAAIRQIGGAE